MAWPLRARHSGAFRDPPMRRRLFPPCEYPAGRALLPLVLFSALVRPQASAIEAGPYVWVDRVDSKRVLMRVPPGSAMPPADEEVMLDQLEQWKWRVEFAAADAALLVTFSQCPHGLGLIPDTLGWSGGGNWSLWPGTFEYAKGALGEPQLPNAGSWAAISESKACEGSKDAVPLGQPSTNFNGLGACQRACAERKGCKGVDFYAKTNWCIFYKKTCATPAKTHDGASSWMLVGGHKPAKTATLHLEEMTFFSAKTWCTSDVSCKGFSYDGTWSDKEKAEGVTKQVVFFSSDRGLNSGKAGWHSYVRKDNPRANCNPEGAGFDCPANPYACLGLSIDADESAIKQSYRALSRKLHPDKIKASERTPDAIKEAEAAFRDISEAHEVLMHGQKRREADKRLRNARKQWESERASIQDIYIKEPYVISLEPEMYPALLPQGHEWLVHFFLPASGECKQMKMAMARVATQLGTGDEEREVQNMKKRKEARFVAGAVFRGVLREKSVALRSNGAGMQEGDTQIVLVVAKDGKNVKILGLSEEISLGIESAGLSSDNRPAFKLESSTHSRVYTGRFDDKLIFRGTISDKEQAKQPEVASFAVSLDDWVPQPTSSTSGRQKPRLFGAVNCGRFPAFCKKKGVDPAIEKRFPQVRMLFPSEVRYEVYSGRSIGRELVAFAQEASRARQAVPELTPDGLNEKAKGPATPLIVLLHREPANAKAALDCALCKTALPMLKRTAARLEQNGVLVGWANCSSDTDVCARLGASEDDTASEWGALRLVMTGTPEPFWSQPLWSTSLLELGETSRAALLAALEAAASTATLLAKAWRQDKARQEL